MGSEMCIRDRHGKPFFAQLSQQHRGPPGGEERPYKNVVDTSSPRLMSRSILVHMFWPPLLLDLLLLLCRRRCRYYCCCCCCCCCGVTRSCVCPKKHKTRNSLLRRIVLRDASRVMKQQQHSSSIAAAAAAAAAAVAAARQQQRPAPLRSLGLIIVLCLRCRACVCSFGVRASWLSLVALVARFRPRDKARSV